MAWGFFPPHILHRRLGNTVWKIAFMGNRYGLLSSVWYGIYGSESSSGSLTSGKMANSPSDDRKESNDLCIGSASVEIRVGVAGSHVT